MGIRHLFSYQHIYIFLPIHLLLFSLLYFSPKKLSLKMGVDDNTITKLHYYFAGTTKRVRTVGMQQQSVKEHQILFVD